MNLVDEQYLFALDVAKLLQYISAKGYKVTLGEAWRSPETAALYAKEGKGIEKSLHIERLAIDLNLYSPDGKYLTDSKDYEQFGILWESLNKINRWGGYFVSKYGGHLVDSDHFERNAK